MRGFHGHGKVPPLLLFGATKPQGRRSKWLRSAQRIRLAFSGVTNATIAGTLLIVSPMWFNVWFAVLARRFDYPDILRRPAEEILARFQAGGSSLILTWWAFMASGGLLVASALMLSLELGPQAPVVSAIAAVVGVLAGFVQVLGLLRWVYLVPTLARLDADAEASEATRAATAVTFRAFHQYLGAGVGEHLGYLLTGAWTVLVGIAVLRSDVIPSWLGWAALPIGAALVLSSAEFLGPNEEHGWRLAGAAVPVLYVAWSLLLLGLGVALLL
jgi:hypothetical protein